MDIQVGDRVQIVDGGMDVTNGLKAKSGKMYGEGGPLWATVISITDWKTGGKFGLPSTVTKVRCVSDSDVVVWQVQPQDIASNVIHASQPEIVQTEPDPIPTETIVEEDPDPVEEEEVSPYSSPIPASNAYAPVMGSETWQNGVPPIGVNTISRPGTSTINSGSLTDLSSAMGDNKKMVVTFEEMSVDQDQIDSIGSPSVERYTIHRTHFQTIPENEDKWKELMKENIRGHQNDKGFPYTDSKMKSNGTTARKYDFQIVPGDTRFSTMKSLEDKLKSFRAAAGIPVHGSLDTAKAMKYFMYNRFKSPDTNLLHNRSVTYVFFSRPDLNILNGDTVVPQCRNHTEAAMTWRRYPEIFKLLTDASRVRDENNFNFLLSNQVTSFDVKDEDLETIEAGKSWREYSIPYGIFYTGRNAGEFTCNFVETSDYSVISLIKLWITYIDNVASGAWKPAYNMNDTAGSEILRSHVFTRTLDYAASAYVFKCGPDGEDILYWSKYYGIYPITTGASALSWDADTPIGTGPKLSIRFRYAWKTDLSPIALLEFNNLARVTGTTIFENSYNPSLAHSSRPFVGTPFIQMDLADPKLIPGGVLAQKRTSIRLKFKPTTVNGLMSDNVLYRSYTGGNYIQEG